MKASEEYLNCGIPDGYDKEVAIHYGKICALEGKIEYVEEQVESLKQGLKIFKEDSLPYSIMFEVCKEFEANLLDFKTELTALTK